MILTSQESFKFDVAIQIQVPEFIFGILTLSHLCVAEFLISIY